MPEADVEQLLDTIERQPMRDALVAWYGDSHREFPWRQTTDPYEILVSEVMSQQTQLDRVVDTWRKFIDRWPFVEDLAAADRAEVVGFWTDHRLGYNNRARYLHEAAQQIGAEFDGTFPRDPETLSELMGVGPYTANAVASFAFNNGDAVVDTNVKRVFYRVFASVRHEPLDGGGEGRGGEGRGGSGESQQYGGTAGNPPDISPNDHNGAFDLPFEAIAQAFMPTGQSRVWNNAIMELGGTVCEKQPRCDESGCPWREWCGAYATGDFTAPDVPTQPSFEGSRRQFRGRIVRALGEHGSLPLDELGPKVRVDYAPEGAHGREWLLDIIEDLADDGLVEMDGETEPAVSLRE